MPEALRVIYDGDKEYHADAEGCEIGDIVIIKLRGDFSAITQAYKVVINRDGYKVWKALKPKTIREDKPGSMEERIKRERQFR